MSLLADYRHCPILGAIGDKLAAISATASVRYNSYVQQMLLESGVHTRVAGNMMYLDEVEAGYSVSEDAREMVARLFGLPREIQLMLESMDVVDAMQWLSDNE